MRAFSNRLRYTTYLLLFFFASLSMGGCTMTADDTLGSNIMPEDQVMLMRHVKIRGGDIIRYNEESQKNETIKTGKKFFETRLYRTDSLLSSNTGYGYLGVRRSDTLGLRTAGFASTILFMNAIDEENGFGYMPIFDTMKLVLTVNNYGGDTLAPIRYKVFELRKSLAENVMKHDERRDQDSVTYINCDLSSVYDADKPIFEFTFPQKELGEGPATLMVPMESTEYSWDFARRLMLIPDNYADANSDWDGYGRSGIEVYSDDEKWAEKFYGLYIKPDLENTPANQRGAFYELDLSASGIMLQGRSRNPKDPSMIKDTVGMYYYFRDTESTINASVIKVEHDYTKSLSGGASTLNSVVMDYTKSREERTEVETCYVEGLGGPSTELYITDALLDTMIELETTAQAEYTKLGINQCVLSIYVDGADYDWNVTQSNWGVLTPLLDRSFTRLGAYVDYNVLTPVVDYDYVYEKNYSATLNYGGFLDRSRGCYTMNITAYMQGLFNYAKSVRQEDGTYAFNENDEGYVKRVIYIGTEATSPYLFTESVLQGVGEKLNAPIQIDLTYTLVK